MTNPIELDFAEAELKILGHIAPELFGGFEGDISDPDRYDQFVTRITPEGTPDENCPSR